MLSLAINFRLTSKPAQVPSLGSDLLFDALQEVRERRHFVQIDERFVCWEANQNSGWSALSMSEPGFGLDGAGNASGILDFVIVDRPEPPHLEENR